jgi:hypothetical protein
MAEDGCRDNAPSVLGERRGKGRGKRKHENLSLVSDGKGGHQSKRFTALGGVR